MKFSAFVILSAALGAYAAPALQSADGAKNVVIEAKDLGNVEVPKLAVRLPNGKPIPKRRRSSFSSPIEAREPQRAPARGGRPARPAAGGAARRPRNADSPFVDEDDPDGTFEAMSVEDPVLEEDAIEDDGVEAASIEDEKVPTIQAREPQRPAQGGRPAGGRPPRAGAAGRPAAANRRPRDVEDETVDEEDYQDDGEPGLQARQFPPPPPPPPRQGAGLAPPRPPIGGARPPVGGARAPPRPPARAPVPPPPRPIGGAPLPPVGGARPPIGGARPPAVGGARSPPGGLPRPRSVESEYEPESKVVEAREPQFRPPPPPPRLPARPPPRPPVRAPVRPAPRPPVRAPVRPPVRPPPPGFPRPRDLEDVVEGGH